MRRLLTAIALCMLWSRMHSSCRQDKDHAYPLSQRNGTQTPQSSGPDSLFMSVQTWVIRGITTRFIFEPAYAYRASQADRAWLERAADSLPCPGIDSKRFGN